MAPRETACCCSSASVWLFLVWASVDLAQVVHFPLCVSFRDGAAPELPVVHLGGCLGGFHWDWTERCHEHQSVFPCVLQPVSQAYAAQWRGWAFPNCSVQHLYQRVSQQCLRVPWAPCCFGQACSPCRNSFLSPEVVGFMPPAPFPGLVADRGTVHVMSLAGV